MAKISFSEDNIKKSAFDFPKIKLKKGEIARVVLLEDPDYAYVHDIRKPKIVDGVAQREMKPGFGNKPPVEDYVYEFVSRPICLGDLGTLEANGSDPDHCPVCREAKVSDRASNPKRRFALHVLRYATKPSGQEIVTPFSVQTLVWSFTDRVFTKLFELKKEWGDLRTKDIVLKCENEIFQGYDISIAAKAEWLENDERKKLTTDTFKENRAQDLELFCGTKKEEKYLEMDLAQVREAWQLATGAKSNLSSDADAALGSVGRVNLDAGLGSLLDTVTEAAPKAQSGEEKLSFDNINDSTGGKEGWASGQQLDDMLNDTSLAAPETTAPQAEQPKKDSMDFSDLLG